MIPEGSRQVYRITLGVQGLGYIYFGPQVFLIYLLWGSSVYYAPAWALWDKCWWCCGLGCADSSNPKPSPDYNLISDFLRV